MGRRGVVGACVAAAPVLLASQPASALDTRASLSIFGSDGDAPPALSDEIVSQLRRRLDPKYVSEKRPEHVRVPRGFLFQKFAVLLMRSCYEAVDDLDFIAMNDFQKQFFLLRADEWEKYVAETDTKQGDLSNPLYFDFISSAQFATITQEMRRGQTFFTELINAEGLSQVVQRDGSKTPLDNSLLPPAFFQLSGDRIYAGLLANFTGAEFFTQPPTPASGPGDVTLLPRFETLHQVIKENGYARDIQVTDAGPLSVAEYAEGRARLEAWAAATKKEVPAGSGVRGGRKVEVKLASPCTLWGRKWLGLQGFMHTDHDVMIAQAFLRESGVPAVVSTKVDANSFSRTYLFL